MKSLAGIKARIDQLLEARGGENEPPSAIILLPENFRGPASDAPYPRIQHTGRAAIITYLPEDGQPSPEPIRALVDGTVRS